MTLKDFVRSPWALFLLTWGLLVLVPDLLVRGRFFTPMYLMGVLGSWLLWGSGIAVVALLRRAARPLALGFAILFALTMTVTLAATLGYYQFFKADVLSLEWEFVLENPTWGYVLASHAVTPGQRWVLGLTVLLLAAALFRLGASSAWRRVRVVHHATGIAAALVICGAITYYCRPLSADSLGLRAVTLGSLSFLVHGSHPHTLPAPRRVELPQRPLKSAPDVVLIINESVGLRESLGPGGQMPQTAAFLSQHEKSAALFPRASTLATATCVSIPSILAGLEPQAPREDFAREPLLWHAARAHGYRTALFSAQEFIISFFSQYFLGADAPDVTMTAPDYRKPPVRVNELGVDDRLAVDAALDFIRHAPGERPYLLVLHLNATHWPCWAPTLSVGKWRDAPPGPRSGLDPVRCSQATRFVDEQAVRVLHELEALHRLDRTLVISTSDHGEVFRPGRPSRRYSYYQDVLAIPFYVHVPAALADRVQVLKENAGQLVSNLDIYPTLLDVWGDWPLPPGDGRPPLTGQSLLRPLPASRVLVSMTDSSISRETPGFAVFHGRWKWAFSEQSGGQLFDEERDPLEEHDLSAQAPAEEVAVLRAEGLRRPYLKKIARDIAPRLASAVGL